MQKLCQSITHYKVYAGKSKYYCIKHLDFFFFVKLPCIEICFPFSLVGIEHKIKEKYMDRYILFLLQRGKATEAPYLDGYGAESPI